MKFEENTVGSLSLLFAKKLDRKYPEREVRQLIFMVFEFFMDFDKTDLVLKANDKIKSNLINDMNVVVDRLYEFEPIQHIFGYSWFYGLKIEVNEHVLIPRQETEELVDLIINNNLNKSPKILDIGTGSGCIAIALSKSIPAAEITAVDVSAEALNVAYKNSNTHGVNIKLIQADVLEKEWYHKLNQKTALFDIIASNPPYITEKEAEKMKSNVLNYEPKHALFVNDSTPLLYYKEIVLFAKMFLNKNGKLYFEINESYGKEVIQLLEENNFVNINLKKDLNDKDRMVSCVMPNQ